MLRKYVSAQIIAIKYIKAVNVIILNLNNIRAERKFNGLFKFLDFKYKFIHKED